MKNNNKQKNSSNLWSLDGQGNMKFSTRAGKFESMMESNDLLETPVMTVILLVLGLLADFFSAKQLFGLLLYDHPFYQAVGVIGFLVIFDLGAILLGHLIKKRTQGFKSRRIGEWLLIGAIVAGVFFTLWLRIVRKDELVPLVGVENSFFESGIEGVTSDLAALPYAIFSGLLPLGTTIVSIIASFIAANPLKKKIQKVRKQKVEMENQINEIHAALAELNADIDLGIRLDEQDVRQLTEKILFVREMGLMYSDYVKTRIAEHIKDAAGINELSKNVHQLILEQHFPNSVIEALEQVENEELEAV